MKRVLQTAAVLALLVATVLLASLQIQPAAAQRPQPPYPALFLRREPLDAATRAEGEALLQRMRRRWSRDHEQLLKDMAAGRGRCGSMSGHLFIDEQVNYGQEVRLFALGYPEVAARWAGPAMQVDRPGHEQRMAQAMQAWLWKAGWPGADEPLVKLCREAPLDQWSFGPSLLAFGDSSGKHLGFLREQARRGRSSAFDALTYRADAEALEILKGSKSCAGRSGSPSSTVRRGSRTCCTSGSPAGWTTWVTTTFSWRWPPSAGG
jgi:hypothetical protein